MSTRKPRIIVIGAGFSGICAAIRLKQSLDLDELILFELEDSLGGTWYSNSYPGAACDVPCHLYSLSFALNPNWTNHYVSRDDILEYLKKVANDYDVNKHIRFNSTVTSTVWDEEKKVWKVYVQRKGEKEIQEFESDFLISGIGYLRIPKIPEEFNDFKGKKFHSSQWDHSIDLSGKKVAVVGSGASAVQIVPEIAKKVDKLFVYQRNPGWIVSRGDFRYSDAMKAVFNYVPGAIWLWRAVLFFGADSFWYAFGGDGIIKRMVKKMCHSHRENQVKDPELREKLIPSFEFGCKRTMFSDDWFPALQRENVELITEKITKVIPNGIQTTEGERNFDVLVLSTGFETEKFLSPVKVIGKGGEPLNGYIKTFLGITVPDCPNFFFLLGPNSLLAHNSVVFMIECQVEYIVKGIKQMMKEGISTIQVKKESQIRFQEEIEKSMENSPWKTGCSSWYLNSQGEVTGLWGGNAQAYHRATKNFNMEDYEVSHF